MIILQIGLGSMGKRRIRNLLYNKIPKANIYGFDINKEKAKEAEKIFNIKTYTNFEDAAKLIRPDAIIISTPPGEQDKYFLHAAKNKVNFFCEVTTTNRGYSRLLPLLKKNFVSAPSCTFRYFPAVKKIKKLILNNEIGNIYGFTYHVGQYLPDWHPWEDYRKLYFSKKETGACKELLVYELIWLLDILGGQIKDIYGIHKKISPLKIQADDIYAVALDLDNKITGTMLIDVLLRTPKRTLKLIGDKGILEWEWKDFKIKFFSIGTKKWKVINMKEGEKERGYINTEDMYREEIKIFFNAVKKHEAFPFSFIDMSRILKKVYEFENSW